MSIVSPTLELIMSRGGAPGGEGSAERPTELERLRSENANLRRKLAMLTAQYIWTEGGSFASIDVQIRQYGYRLEKTTDSGKDPRIVPL